MSFWNNKPSTPSSTPRPGVPSPGKLVTPWSSKPATPASPVKNPLTKPDFFKGGGPFLKKTKYQMKEEAKAGKLVIPGTGGQKMTEKQVQDLFKRPEFSYGKVGTHFNKTEAIRTLKEMRKKDGGNIMSNQGRVRRLFEQKWGLKSGKDY